MDDKRKTNDDSSKTVSQDDLEKVAKNFRGRVKSALTLISNFINNEKQIFDKHDLMNKIQKINTIYNNFDQTDADLPPESLKMKEFGKKKITKPKPNHNKNLKN